MVQKGLALLVFQTADECKEVRPTAKVPRGEGWQYELKFDGYRSIALLAR